jgi:hypothetical protein
MRLGVLADIHSDLSGLENALHIVEKLNCDRLVCLGDIVGCSYHYQDYLEGRDPDECVRLVRENCDDVIAGNHDLFIARRMPEYFRELNYPENWFELDPGRKKIISEDDAWLFDDEMPFGHSDASIEYLASLPETLTVDGGSVYLSHYLFPDLTGSTKTAPAEKSGFIPHLDHLKKQQATIGLIGHAHPEGYAEISDKVTGVFGYRKNNVTCFPAIIIAPAVTRSHARNGLMIFDTVSMLVEAIPL